MESLHPTVTRVSRTHRLCVSQHSVDDIRRIQRPIRLGTDEAVMTPMLWDILWSDPTDDDSVLGILSNTQRGGTGMSSKSQYCFVFPSCKQRMHFHGTCGREQHLQVRS